MNKRELRDSVRIEIQIAEALAILGQAVGKHNQCYKALREALLERDTLRTQLSAAEEVIEYLAGQYARLENQTDIHIKHGYREPWTKEEMINEARARSHPERQPKP